MLIAFALPWLASCSFVDALRSHAHSDSSIQRIARWTDPESWKVWTPKFGVDLFARSRRVANRAADRLVRIPNELRDMTERAVASTARLGVDLDPRRDIRKLTKSLRALPELLHLERGWPADASDPIRDVAIARPAAADRRGRIERLIDRFW
ncbi:MAG: hypothetical protein KDB80_11005 [Planctomycetes bacterium]|nr:hypothetical protein [Planctomycetota bacterium]